MEKIDMLSLLRFIFQKVFSTCSTLMLLGVYALVLIASVFIEKEYGEQSVKEWVYQHPLWIAIHVWLVIAFIVKCMQMKLWQQGNYAVCMLHTAFICILSGAYLTHLLSFEGVTHLCEGESTAWIHTSERAYRLPFTIYLNDFKLQRYRGSQIPSSYECHLTLSSPHDEQSEVMYMSGMLHKDGYRIYQTSYDADEQGVWLLIRYDKWGVLVTYVGYVLLLLAMIGTWIDRHSHFRQLIKRLSVFVILVGMAFNAPSISAATTINKVRLSQQTISKEQAIQWKSVQIISSSGRVEPFNTLALQLLRELYRHETYQGISAEQVVIGFIINPSFWNTVPLIYQSNPQIALTYKLSHSKYLSYSELFDKEGNYLLKEAVERAYQKSEFERTAFERDLLKLDKRVYLLYALHHGYLFSMLQKDFLASYRLAVEDGLYYDKWQRTEVMLKELLNSQNTHRDSMLLSKNKVRLELLYNKLHLFNKVSWGYIIVGLFLLGLILCSLSKGKQSWIIRMLLFSKFGLIVVFLLHTLGILIRWYISGHAPLVHSYETMVYLAWSIALAGIYFMRRSPLTMSLTSCMAGLLLQVCHLLFLNEEITPLLPVLQSCWLAIHVAVVMAGYGFLSLSCIVGIFSLLWMTTLRVHTPFPVVSHLRIVNEISLHIGLYLLIAGIFLGAVWANESWGSYWNWDPKETWALITMIIYTLVLHTRLISRLCSDYVFHLLSVVAFSSVCMTYLGVNAFWTGLHSYGNGDKSVEIHLLVGTLLGLSIIVLYVLVMRLMHRVCRSR